MNDLKKTDGYVLVVIIGILTILSLMAITFATLSRIETRATRNYTDSVKCEMVAKAGLEHALYVLRLDKFGTDKIAYDSDPPDLYDENYDWPGETWMPGNIDLLNPTTSFAGNAVDDCDNDGDDTPESKWIYFPATTSTSKLDIRLPGKLRARYAVLITDDREARVNINVTGNKAGSSNVHTSNEGWSTFENDLSFVIEQAPSLNSTDGDNIASDIIDGIDGRLGSDPTPGTSTANEDSGIIPDPEADGIDNDGDWDSSTHDTNSNGIPDSVDPVETNVDEPDEATNEPNEFKSIFPYDDDVPFGLLSEAEIMGTSSYTSRLETIFNKWFVSEIDQDFLNSRLTTYSADTILCPEYQLDGVGTSTMLNINALVNDGTYTDIQKVEMIRDTLLAGDITGAVGSDGYKERHQLAVNIKDFIDSDDTVTMYPDPLNPPDTYYGIERTPYINEVEAWTTTGTDEFIELFNPYDTDINIAGWEIWQNGGATIITLTGPTILSQDYYVIADQLGANVDQVDAASTIGINDLDNGGEKLILRDSSGTVVQVTTYGSANQDDTCSLNDPRPIPLTATASDPWSWTTTASNTIGAQNSNFDPTVGDDGWDNTTWSNSFLIANRRFSNKGYMGFIHRGSEWSSFKVDDSSANQNVLHYITITDPSTDNIDNDGDGDIDSADTGSQAGDLDGPEYRIPGLINVNTAPADVLKSLPVVGTLTAATDIANGTKPYDSIRDLLVSIAGITDTSATNNKWNREKRFRAISNLITTRSNVFTVYVTAQITDELMSKVFAEKRILAIVDRSVDPIKVRYFRWLVE